MTIAQFEATFPDEDACQAYLVARRWPNGVNCPRCGNAEVYALGVGLSLAVLRRALRRTGYRFSHIAGTIFENTTSRCASGFASSI